MAIQPTKCFYIVELQEGVWLDGSFGDPGRTLVKESARKHPTFNDALQTQAYHCRKNPHRNWEESKIITIKRR